LSSDYIIDLGPEGGNGGGQVVACGSPGDLMKGAKGYTSQYLREYAVQIAERMEKIG